MHTYYEGHDAFIIGLRAEEMLCAEDIAKECLRKAEGMDWRRAECELFRFSDCALLLMRPAQPKYVRGSREGLRLRRKR